MFSIYNFFNLKGHSQVSLGDVNYAAKYTITYSKHINFILIYFIYKNFYKLRISTVGKNIIKDR